MEWGQQGMGKGTKMVDTNIYISLINLRLDQNFATKV